MAPFPADLLTIISGVIIFAASQLTQKIYIDPAQQLKRTIADITAKITVYANTAGSSLDSERQKAAENAFRQAAGALRGDASIIPQYNLWRRLAHLPPHQNIEDAYGRLIGLSNDVGRGNYERFSQWLSEVNELLGAPTFRSNMSTIQESEAKNHDQAPLRAPLRPIKSEPEPKTTIQQVGTPPDH